MHEIPSTYTTHLPTHQVVLANGSSVDTECPGKKVRDIVSDAGLIYGGCSHCCEEFVYLYGTDEWIPERDFEIRITKAAGLLKKTIGLF